MWGHGRHDSRGLQADSVPSCPPPDDLGGQVVPAWRPIVDLHHRIGRPCTASRRAANSPPPTTSSPTDSVRVGGGPASRLGRGHVRRCCRQPVPTASGRSASATPRVAQPLEMPRPNRSDSVGAAVSSSPTTPSVVMPTASGRVTVSRAEPTADHHPRQPGGRRRRASSTVSVYERGRRGTADMGSAAFTAIRSPYNPTQRAQRSSTGASRPPRSTASATRSGSCPACPIRSATEQLHPLGRGCPEGPGGRGGSAT